MRQCSLLSRGEPELEMVGESIGHSPGAKSAGRRSNMTYPRNRQ